MLIKLVYKINIFCRILFLIFLIPFNAFAQSAHFDPATVSEIPTAGPNCYFTALTANSLLHVPALMLSSDFAALLFLNPALCQQVQIPQPGDIGLVESHPSFNIHEIFHAFIFLGENLRFEKASAYGSDAFGFVSTPSQPVTRFVRCQSMQSWVDQSIKKLPAPFSKLALQIDRIESIIDSRVSSKTSKTYEDLKFAFATLEQDFGNPKDLIQNELAKRLQEENIVVTPMPSTYDNQFYKFALAHPEKISDQSVFVYMWLGARLEEIDYIFENYKFLKPAHLVP